MLHKIKSINEKIENGIIKKTDFFPLLAKCDEAICDFVEKKGTTHILPYDELKFDTDNRLKTVLNKQKEFVRNPVITIQENIKTKFQYLNEFLSKYHIGFAQKVKINEYGTVSVELSCIIMCNASTSKMLSEKKYFEDQIAFLRKIGLELADDGRSGYYLKNSSNNISVIKNLLKERKCKQIKFLLSEDTISKIEFNFNISDIEGFSEKIVKKEYFVSNENLNDEEIEDIQRNIANIFRTYSIGQYIGAQVNNAYCFLIENYFSEICKIFNFECKTYRKIVEYYKDEKNKNIQIKKIEKEIGNNLSFSDINKINSEIKRKINDFSLSKLYFYITEFYVDKYGYINAHFEFLGCNFNLQKAASETYMNDCFQMFGCKENKDFLMLDTAENKNKILSMFRELCPTTNIVHIMSETKDDIFYIKSFDIIINDISAILNTTNI